MTKLKNTKKGMAKKALSISLVAAMLATSNVPVWAAEFTDGTDAVVEAPVVEEFAAEAPVEEVPATDVELQVATNGYTVETNMELSAADWNSNLIWSRKDGESADKFILEKDGVPQTPTKVEIWARDSKMVGEATVSDGNLSAAFSSLKPTETSFKEGATLTAKIYVGEDVAYECTMPVKAVDISNGWKLDVTKNTGNYTGKAQTPELAVTNNGATATVVVNFANGTDAVNVGSYAYTVQGTGSYTGTIKSSNDYVIRAVAATTDNVLVELSGETTYHGDNTVPTVKVTDKLANKEISSDLYTVSFTPAVGKFNKDNVKVQFKDAKEVKSNFTTGSDIAAGCITGSFKVNALDLSKLGDTYTVSVADKTASTNVTIDDITFTDKATGEIVDSTKIFPTAEVVISTTNNTEAGKAGTVTLTSNAKDKITGTYTANFNVVSNILTKDQVSFPKGAVLNGMALDANTTVTNANNKITTELNNVTYTGGEVKPLEKAYEKLVLTESVTTTPVELKLGTDYVLEYKNNTDSTEVSGKQGTLTVKFIGSYSGSWTHTFTIKQAAANVEDKNVSYESGKNTYNVEAKVVTGTKETPVPASEYEVITTKAGHKIGDIATGKVIFRNPNYTIVGGTKDNDTKCYYKEINSTVVGKSLTNCTGSVVGEYTYIGEAITPKLSVKDGNYELQLGVDYEIKTKVGENAGPAYVIVKGKGNYDGELRIDYEIKKANLKDAKVLNATGKTVYDVSYTGTAVKPDVTTIKIGNVTLKEYDPIKKTGDYKLTYDENAVNVGEYTFTITAVAGSDKVEGTYEGKFKVLPNELQGKFVEKVSGTEVSAVLPVSKTGAKYTGKEIKISDFKTAYVLKDNKTNTVLTEGKDYKLEYTNNINAGKATVTAYGLGNHAALDTNGKLKAIASMEYYIQGTATIANNWVVKINNAEYAGGLAVEPEVVVVDPTTKVRLVQGRDYTVETSKTAIETGIKASELTIKGNGSFTTTDASNTKLDLSSSKLTWDVVKKDLKNTEVTVSDKNVTVMNGTVMVPSSEYDVTFSEDGKTVTVTAKADSKFYTGAKEVATTGAPVGKAVINEVKVVGNKATVILEGEADDAVGYDYVISTEEDYKNGRLPDGIHKNQLSTETTYQYLQKGTYYAYCHAWKKVDGKKVFGEWSNIYEFTVGATTPATPAITNVKVSKNTVTVTYTKCKDATGYDVVLGSAKKKVNGELRPVNYGKLVKKVTKGNVVTATFTKVPKGTYYVGLHAYNRSSVDNKKVFSPWSATKTIKVK